MKKNRGFFETENGLNATVFRLDNPNASNVANACKRLPGYAAILQDEQKKFYVVEVMFPSETVYLLYFHRPKLGESKENVREKFATLFKEKLNETIDEVWFAVYNDHAYIAEQWFCRLLKGAVKETVPPSILTLLNRRW